MAYFDLPLEQLRSYRSSVGIPDDFDSFWAGEMTDARRFPMEIDQRDVTSFFTLVRTWDVSFPGYGGQPIRAWVHEPAHYDAPLRTVVHFHGYSGGRGIPEQGQFFALAGYRHIVMDNRGQGWSMVGATPDLSPDSGRSTVPGLVTRGIESPASHYYTRLFVDAARVVDAAAALPLADTSQIFVTGGSQGGAMAIAAAGLHQGVAGVMPNVPFLSDIPRAVQLATTDPMLELVRYLAMYPEMEQTALETLSYFDTVNLGSRATAPALFSVGLLDPVSPPSTVFAAFHAYGGQDKQLSVFAYNAHEGGGERHEVTKLGWLHAHRPAGAELGHHSA